jgi:RNA polymerase sigma-70 factor (ECF subfamily)
MEVIVQNTDSKKQSEKELVTEIINGNSELFSLIVDKYQKKILIFIQRYVYNKDDADDLVQEIFIKVYHNLFQFKFNSSLETWIYRIAINQCIDFKKKNNRKSNFTLIKNYEEQIKNIKSEQKTPEEKYEIESIRKNILEILDKNLSNKQKSIFILKYFEDFSIKKIAAIMKMSEGTVKTHLSRSYNKIRSEIKELLI